MKASMIMSVGNDINSINMSDADYISYIQLIYSILGGHFLRETFYLYFPLSFSPETILRSYRRLEQEAACFPQGHRIVWRIAGT